MLNMINLREIDITETSSLYLIHVIYVFIVSVLLLNFLIAIFSDSVNIVNENHDVIHDVQRLSIVHTVEQRALWLFRRLYFRFHRKHFLHKDGRVYLGVRHWLD